MPLFRHSGTPLIGILTMATCTALALLLVPSDHSPAGALFLPALVLVIGLLGPVVAVTTRFTNMVFRIEHLLMLGLTYWILLDLLQGAYSLQEVSRSGTLAGLATIGLFAAAVWSAFLHRPWPLPAGLKRACQVEASSQTLFYIILACVSLSLLRFALPCRFDIYVMITSLANNRWDAPWTRGSLGGWDAFLDHLPYFGYLLPTLTVLLANKARRGWIDLNVITSIALTLVVMVFLAHSGNRRIIGVMSGAALICWVSLQGRATRSSTLIAAAIGAAILLFVMQVMLQYRGVGYGKMITDGEVHIDYQRLHVDDNFLRLSQIIELIPDQYDYTYHRTLVWVVVRPVPRILWPSKPTGPGFSLPDALGYRGVSLSSSALGELYMSGGWLAIVVGGWLYGRLAGVFNQFVSTGTSPVRFLMYAAGGMALFAGVRSMIDVVLMSYMLLAWYVFVAVLHLPMAKQNSHSVHVRA